MQKNTTRQTSEVTSSPRELQTPGTPCQRESSQHQVWTHSRPDLTPTGQISHPSSIQTATHNTCWPGSPLSVWYVPNNDRWKGPKGPQTPEVTTSYYKKYTAKCPQYCGEMTARRSTWFTFLWSKSWEWCPFVYVRHIGHRSRWVSNKDVELGLAEVAERLAAPLDPYGGSEVGRVQHVPGAGHAAPPSGEAAARGRAPASVTSPLPGWATPAAIAPPPPAPPPPRSPAPTLARNTTAQASTV